MWGRIGRRTTDDDDDDDDGRKKVAEEGEKMGTGQEVRIKQLLALASIV